MKIFNKENNINKVYVQLSDINIIKTNMKYIPTSILEKTKNLVIDDKNKNDFIYFIDKNEISFFKSLSWIIDYKDYKDIDNYNLLKKEKDVLADICSILNKKTDNEVELNKAKFLTYKYNSISKIRLLREGKLSIDFPFVPDSNKESFIKSNYTYELKEGLDKNLIFLFRKDGKDLSSNDIIPSRMIENALTLVLLDRKQNDEYSNNLVISNKLISNDKYLVASFVNKSEIKNIKFMNYKKNI